MDNKQIWFIDNFCHECTNKYYLSIFLLKIRAFVAKNNLINDVSAKYVKEPQILIQLHNSFRPFEKVVISQH